MLCWVSRHAGVVDWTCQEPRRDEVPAGQLHWNDATGSERSSSELGRLRKRQEVRIFEFYREVLHGRETAWGSAYVQWVLRSLPRPSCRLHWFCSRCRAAAFLRSSCISGIQKSEMALAYKRGAQKFPNYAWDSLTKYKELSNGKFSRYITETDQHCFVVRKVIIATRPYGSTWATSWMKTKEWTMPMVTPGANQTTLLFSRPKLPTRKPMLWELKQIWDLKENFTRIWDFLRTSKNTRTRAEWWSRLIQQ